MASGMAHETGGTLECGLDSLAHEKTLSFRVRVVVLVVLWIRGMEFGAGPSLVSRVHWPRREEKK